MEINHLFDLYDSFHLHLFSDGETIKSNWHTFEAGTPKTTIINWFYEQNPLFAIYPYSLQRDGTMKLVYKASVDPEREDIHE